MVVKQRRDMLVTAALPYANGAIHLGHMVEYVQADIWVRFQRLRGHTCLFLCGDDAHGTPIMLSAQKQGITPDTLVANMHAEHARDFDDFLIGCDNFYTTHSLENRRLCELIYRRLQTRGDIFTRTIDQAFDRQKKMFLPDRFIRGECPRCGTSDQYGDVCEKCGATYSPTDLVNAVSALSGVAPITKQSEHFFFALDKYSEFLQQWINAGHCQPQIAHKLAEWFAQGLKPWDISRDAPYFGFEIPGAEGKYFYVWLDAPVGYMASLQNLIHKRPGLTFDAYWGKESQAELYHFVGKDIVYFHALFWPALLHSAGFRLPSAIHVHGYLTINGHKMSKSRGTFITVRRYLNELNPEYLRYYFAAKLSAKVEDIDLNLTDFMQRVNADLVGKYVNLASRCAGFISKKFAGRLASALPQPELFTEFVTAGTTIAQHYEQLEYNKAMRAIMALADRANQYIDQQQPWALAKDLANDARVHAIYTQGLNLFKLLTTYLQPVLPLTTHKVIDFFNITALRWEDRAQPLVDHVIKPFKPLMQRVSETAIDALTQR